MGKNHVHSGTSKVHQLIPDETRRELRKLQSTLKKAA